MKTTFLIVVFLCVINISISLGPIYKRCVIIKDCPEVIELLKIKPHTDGNKKYLQKLRCEKESNVVKVWCNIDRKELILPDVKKDARCGNYVIPDYGMRLIVGGGEDSYVGQFPWIGMLEYRNRRMKLEPKCGGSLISPQFVLTAAHCLIVPDSAGKLESVLFGEFDTAVAVDCQKSYSAAEPICEDVTQRYLVENFVVHQFYQESALAGLHHHDIGLVKTKEPVTYTKFINTVCLPPVDFVVEPPKDEDISLTVAGWGLTEQGFASSKLQQLGVPYYDAQKCTDFLKYNITNTQFCAGGETGKDSCRGDSGGPLITYNNGRGVLVGIVSLSIGRTCGSGRPNIYTDVAKYSHWINENIQ